MIVRVTPDKRFIQLVDYTEDEGDQMNISFKKRISSWRFNPLVRRGVWDGYIKFIDKYNRIPIGLWNKIIEECKKHNITLEFQGLDELVNQDFNQEEFEEWMWEFYAGTRYGKGGDREIRAYQTQGMADTLKYYKSRSELATSAGKTIIMFTIFAYMKIKGWANKSLIIVPNKSLVIQTYEGFMEYSEGTSLEGNFKIQMFGGGASKEKKDVDIAIGTYQTLRNFETEYFDDIDCIAVDEAHHTQSKSIKTIITKGYDSKYRYGLSGTMDSGDTAESMTLDAYLGPIVNKVSAKFLIDNGFATAIYVKQVHLDYMSDENREELCKLRMRKGDEIDGAKLLDIEKKLVIENRSRLRYICNIIEKTSKNVLILYSDIKHGYGKSIYNYVRENFDDKVAFYVDGGTGSAAREEYKAAMETGQNRVLIASFGTFSTGISINNIHHIMFVESFKADRIIRQSIGRGMRLLEGKDKVWLWDFVDDYRWGDDNRTKNNYLYRHGVARIKTYKEQGFPCKIYKVKL